MASGDFAPGELSVTVGAVTRTTATNPNPIILLILRDKSFEDHYQFNGLFSSGAADHNGVINLFDNTPSPPDGVAPGTGNLTGSVPLTAPDVSLFDASPSFFGGGPGVIGEGTVEFQVTSITLVPEPSTALLLGSGLLALAVHGRRRKA